MRRIATFHPEEPERLASELHRFEDTVSRNFDVLPGRFEPRLSWSNWVSDESTALAYDVITRIDTMVTPITATLPSVTADTRSKVLGLVKRGANNITVIPVETDVTINGNISQNISVDGIYFYIHDGEIWYRFL